MTMESQVKPPSTSSKAVLARPEHALAAKLRQAGKQHRLKTKHSSLGGGQHQSRAAVLAEHAVEKRDFGISAVILTIVVVTKLTVAHAAWTTAVGHATAILAGHSGTAVAHNIGGHAVHSVFHHAAQTAKKSLDLGWVVIEADHVENGAEFYYALGLAQAAIDANNIGAGCTILWSAPLERFETQVGHHWASAFTAKDVWSFEANKGPIQNNMAFSCGTFGINWQVSLADKVLDVLFGVTHAKTTDLYNKLYSALQQYRAKWDGEFPGKNPFGDGARKYIDDALFSNILKTMEQVFGEGVCDYLV